MEFRKGSPLSMRGDVWTATEEHLIGLCPVPTPALALGEREKLSSERRSYRDGTPMGFGIISSKKIKECDWIERRNANDQWNEPTPVFDSCGDDSRDGWFVVPS